MPADPKTAAREDARQLLHRFGYFQPEMTDAFADALTVQDVEIERLRAEMTAARFAPMGDNHHNAMLCPYCNPLKHPEIAHGRT